MDRNLYAAARTGDVGFLSQLGDGDSYDLHATTPQRNTALHIAAKFGHESFAVEILLRCQGFHMQRNDKGDTPLHVAARAGHVSVVRGLIKACSFRGRDAEGGGGDVVEPPYEMLRARNREESTALHEAVRHGHVEVARVLLGEDEDLACHVNKAMETPLYLAAEMGALETVQKIFGIAAVIVESGPDGRTPLHAAVIGGHLEVVKELLTERRNLINQADTFKSTPLHYASSAGHFGIVQLLLEMDPSLAYLKDENGLSPLHLAAGAGHSNVVHEILNFCPDTSEILDQSGRNALHLAIDSEEEEVVQELLRIPEVKELVNERDSEGDTAMHVAAKKECSGIVQLLLESECVDLGVMNNYGQTALDCIELKTAYTYDQIVIWKALEEAGAPGGKRRHKQERRRRPMPSPKSVDESYKTMANTLSVVAALIATVTFAAIFTMPGVDASEVGNIPSIKKAAFKAFVISDTVAMCSSMVVALVLVWAVPGVPGMVVNAVRWALRLMWVALGGMVVTFVTAVYIIVHQECLWLSVVVCVLGCSVPFVVTPIVTLSARSMPHPKKDFQYNQIQAPLA